MRVGIIGTGAIAYRHAEAYRNIGFEVTVCTNRTVENGLRFSRATGAKFVDTAEKLCQHPNVDYVDVCTMPNYRFPVVELCAKNKRHVLVQKPMATDLDTARRMIVTAREASIQLGVMSQHRFDESVQFLKEAISNGRLGQILQADAYVKWYRPPEYYNRPSKGSWAGEGGGALINQGIHHVDLLLYLIGAVDEVIAYWKLGALHKIESEDSISALLQYSCGAAGVIQASTSLWPGYTERVEISGTKGTAIITGDNLTAWDVQEETGEVAPIVRQQHTSGASSSPMAISVSSFERQFLEFDESCKAGRKPLCSGVDGFRALQVVRSIYESCVQKQPIHIGSDFI